ncbi:MAG: hypothetical protein KGS72_25895, partial [Cyanobacteria bacterium REEB67]|nr:hypothetical protein [Cyanobacteria bacterium REEB67]
EKAETHAAAGVATAAAADAQAVKTVDGQPTRDPLAKGIDKELHGSGSKDAGAFEASRTNASDGSLRDRQSLAAEQEDSIEISFPGGRASRANPLTEKDIDVNRVEHQVERTGPKSFALGVQFQEGKDLREAGKAPNANADQRSAVEKLSDFVGAATRRAADPANYARYLQDEIDKFVGIGEGLNLAKEETKSNASHAWKALTDGTVANFLAQPNALNEPMFKAVASAFEAMKNDPAVVDRALHALGEHLLRASQEYSEMTARQQGQVIGKTAFSMVNPEGSTEAGEAVLKIADHVATHVDAAVMKGIERAHAAVQELAKTSPAVAAQTKQMLLDYTNRLGLSGPQLQLAGIPDGYFAGMTAGAGKTENYLAMSAGSEARGNLGYGPEGYREVQPRAEFTAVEREAIARQAKTDAIRLITHAENAEPEVTDDLMALAKIHKGEMVGLEYRLKSVESLTRKIENGSEAGQIKDALRYTMIFPDDQLVEKTETILRAMELDGYEALKVKNTFKPNVPYKGVNVCLIKNEQMFELQFHSPGSYDLKHYNHPLYEFARELCEYDEVNKNNVYYPRAIAEKAIAKNIDKLADYPHLQKTARRYLLVTNAEMVAKDVYDAVEDQLKVRCNQFPNPRNIDNLKDLDKFGGKK